MKSKDHRLLEEAYAQIVENLIGMDTSWEDGDVKVTMKDVWKYLDDNDIKSKDIKVSELKPILIDQDYTKAQKERVDKADTSFPIIVTKSKEKFKSILDGNHRLFKAVRDDIETLPARILDLDDKNTPKEFKMLFD